MVIFEKGLDGRTREAKIPTVAGLRLANGELAYIVIGTEYGHIHTSAGDVRVWKSYSGAYRAAKRYVAF